MAADQIAGTLGLNKLGLWAQSRFGRGVGVLNNRPHRLALACTLLMQSPVWASEPEPQLDTVTLRLGADALLSADVGVNMRLGRRFHVLADGTHAFDRYRQGSVYLGGGLVFAQQLPDADHWFREIVAEGGVRLAYWYGRQGDPPPPWVQPSWHAMLGAELAVTGRTVVSASHGLELFGTAGVLVMPGLFVPGIPVAPVLRLGLGWAN